MKVVVTEPCGVLKGELKYTSEFGRGGCQGFVTAADLTIDGITRKIVVKQFYRESYDDKGIDFTQNPDEEVDKSYIAFLILKEVGFKITPYFAKIQTDKSKLLAMTDLAAAPNLEVYDEKKLHRMGLEQKLAEFKNGKNILLEFHRNSLLRGIHSIGLGFGVSHLVVHNKDTNQAEVFVVDVGEFSQGTPAYKVLTGVDLLRVPLEEILHTHKQLMNKQFSGKDATASIKRKSRINYFRELLFQYYSLGEGSSCGENEKPVRNAIFPKKDMPSHLLNLKYDFLRHERQLSGLLGRSILSIQDEKVPDYFINLAYMMHLDRRIRWRIDARKALENHEPVPGINDYPPGIVFFDKKINEEIEIEWWSHHLWQEDKKYCIVLRLPWQDADRLTGYLYQGYIPSEINIQPRNIVSITRADRELTGAGKFRTKALYSLDPAKIKVGKAFDRDKYFRVGEEIFLAQYTSV